MKYSVATYLGFAITGLALIVKGLLPAEVLGAPVTFMTYTATIMNIGILGLDQALLRFYHEPPAGAGAAAAVRGLHADFGGVYDAAGRSGQRVLCAAAGSGVRSGQRRAGHCAAAVPQRGAVYAGALLKRAAALENDLRAYTAETLWMQGCYNLFYLLPGFLHPTSLFWRLRRF